MIGCCWWGGYACVRGTGGMYGNSAPAIQFCCEPKTALKNKAHYRTKQNHCRGWKSRYQSGPPEMIPKITASSLPNELAHQGLPLLPRPAKWGSRKPLPEPFRTYHCSCGSEIKKLPPPQLKACPSLEVGD